MCFGRIVETLNTKKERHPINIRIVCALFVRTQKFAGRLQLQPLNSVDSMCGGLLYFIWLVAFSEHLYYAMRYLLVSEYYYCHIPYNMGVRVLLII